jgi:hypothetical protein
VSEVDLNLIQQVKDKWMFQATARYSYYADFFQNFVKHDFEQHIIRDPALENATDDKKRAGRDKDSFH